jgi:hypothetical protein
MRRWAAWPRVCGWCWIYKSLKEILPRAGHTRRFISFPGGNPRGLCASLSWIRALTNFRHLYPSCCCPSLFLGTLDRGYGVGAALSGQEGVPGVRRGRNTKTGILFRVSRRTMEPGSSWRSCVLRTEGRVSSVSGWIGILRSNTSLGIVEVLARWSRRGTGVPADGREFSGRGNGALDGQYTVLQCAFACCGGFSRQHDVEFSTVRRSAGLSVWV